MKLFIFFAVLAVARSYPTLSPLDEEDAYLTVPEIITKYGYPAETHHVTTEDGYILTLHRIPRGKSSKPVLVQHGLLSSSADFVITGVEQGLAFLLADEGYDVWLGNGRGNTNSRNHTTLDPNTDPEFWHFTWHEIGYYDLPAMIDHILATTNQTSLFYAGHSQGSTVYYVMASSRPEYNSKVRVAFNMAAVGYMSHMTSPLMLFLANWAAPIDMLFEYLGWNEFFPNNEFITWAGEQFCADEDPTQVLCSDFLFLLCGYSPSELNATQIPIYLGHLPAGASTRQVVHYAQEILSGYFRRYDFGENNTSVYGSDTPPSYDLSQITAPTYLFHSYNDLMANEIDVDRLCNEMGESCVAKIIVAEESFNHLDYLIGIRAPELVYSVMFDLMKQYV